MRYKIPSIDRISNTKFVKKIHKISKSNTTMNVLAKTIAIIIIWFGALIPSWIYIILRLLIDPVTVIEELILLGIVIIPLGGAQLVLAIAAFMISVSVIIEDII